MSSLSVSAQPVGRCSTAFRGSRLKKVPTTPVYASRSIDGKGCNRAFRSLIKDATVPHIYQAAVCSAESRGTGEANEQPTCSRRQLGRAAAALVLTPFLLAAPGSAVPAQAADASNPELRASLRKYIKKKRADPLETYIPVLLVAKEQLESANELLVLDTKGARQMLREGVFKSVRDAARAVAQLSTPEADASEGLSPEAQRLSSTFFESLEAYDQTLQVALRRDTVDVDSSRSALKQVLQDLDNVLAVVPEDMMVRAKRVAEANRSSGGSGEDVRDIATAAAETRRLERLMK